jgi:hypothetical protein
MRYGVLWAAPLLMLMALTPGRFPSTQRWDEDVQLSDGAIIRVHREVQYLPGHGEFHQTSGWMVGGERLTLVDPATNQRLIWEGQCENLA